MAHSVSGFLPGVAQFGPTRIPGPPSTVSLGNNRLNGWFRWIPVNPCSSGPHPPSPSHLFWCHVILKDSGSGTREEGRMVKLTDGMDIDASLRSDLLPGTHVMCQSARSTEHLPHEPADCRLGGRSRAAFIPVAEQNYTPEEDVGGKAEKRLKKRKHEQKRKGKNYAGQSILASLGLHRTGFPTRQNPIFTRAKKQYWTPFTRFTADQQPPVPNLVYITQRAALNRSTYVYPGRSH
jgi:hypothetical protein